MAESSLFQVGDVVVFNWEQIDDEGWMDSYLQIVSIDLGRGSFDPVLYIVEILKSKGQRSGKQTTVRENQVKGVPPLVALAAIGEISG
jgi:hypothetical protein